MCRYSEKRALFQSTLPARGATALAPSKRCCFSKFQSTLPARGATAGPLGRKPVIYKFQSTLPARGATPFLSRRIKRGTFQSTLPARGATADGYDCRRIADDFNPRSPHGERPPASGRDRRCSGISIHAPRTGSDEKLFAHQIATVISIHAPRTGSDGRRPRDRAPLTRISIHAPRTGSDDIADITITIWGLFQSTLPARGATLFRALRRAHIVISIHAPRTGSDVFADCNIRRVTHFNPRSPHGERHVSDFSEYLNAGHFNPRSPHGERRVFITSNERIKNFNPRSPHGERPVRSAARRPECGYFNPRSPHGERRTSRTETNFFIVISIHAPRTGSDPAS